MRRELPPFNSIVVADAVFRKGSFKAAASDLNVTPSAVSHQIKNLENWLGFDLFNRQTKAITPTPTGMSFLERIRISLDEIEEATRDTNEAKGARKTLRVQTTDSFANMVLVKRAQGFHQGGTSVKSAPRIRISTIDHSIAPVKSCSDVAILYGDGNFAGASVISSMQESLLPVCSPNLARKMGLAENIDMNQVRDILALPIITDYLLGTSWRRWCDFMGHTLNAAETRHIEGALLVNHSHLAIEAAISGQGVALVSDILAGDALKAGQLVPLTAKRLTTGYGYHVVTANDPVPRNVQNFANWLTDEIANR